MFFSASVIINVDAPTVWNVLTKPDLMTLWMGEPGMNLEVNTPWQIGLPIVIRGFHHVDFENKGIVLQFNKYSNLSYTHLSSVSKLPDLPENYSVIEFTLTAVEKQIRLNLQITNFPTESIRKHLEFYWRTTIFKIKECAEHS